MTISTAEEFTEGEVFAFEEGFGGDGLESSKLEDLDFDLEVHQCEKFGPIYVPSSYDDLMELWLEMSKTNSCQQKNRSDGNISQVRKFYS